MDTDIRVSTESRTLEKNILLPLQQGSEPATFQSWVQHSSHWAIPAPYMGGVLGTTGQHPCGGAGDCIGSHRPTPLTKRLQSILVTEYPELNLRLFYPLFFFYSFTKLMIMKNLCKQTLAKIMKAPTQPSHPNKQIQLMTKTYSCSHCFSNIGFSHGDGTVRAPWSNQQQFAEGVQRGSIAVWDGGFLRGVLVKPGLPCLKVEVESGEAEKFWQKKFEILPWLKSLLLTNGNYNPKVKVVYFSKGCCLKVQALKNGC